MKIASFFGKKTSIKLFRFNLVWTFILLVSLLIKGFDDKDIENSISTKKVKKDSKKSTVKSSKTNTKKTSESRK